MNQNWMSKRSEEVFGKPLSELTQVEINEAEDDRRVSQPDAAILRASIVRLASMTSPTFADAGLEIGSAVL